MSKLEELLQEVKVEWLPLDDIARFRRGSFPQPYGNSEWYDGEESMPFVQVNDVGFNMKLVEKTKNRISKKAQPKSIFVPENTVIVTLQGSIGRVAITQYDSYVDRTLAIFEEYKKEVDLKYFAYQLEAKFNVEKDKARGNIIKTITKDDFKRFEIPIPCPDNPEKSLEIQQEIVRVLDELTSLTNQLTNELEKERQNRKKQFEFFREQLFNNKSDNESWKILEEIIIKTYSGSTPRAGDVQYYNNGTIPWLRTQEVRFCEILDTEIKITELAVEKTGAKWIPINCVIIAISGATAGRSAINKIPLTTNQHCSCLEINSDKALYKYVYHWIKFNYENIKSLGRGARGDLNSCIIKNFKIPIPSLEEQERIVKLLDQFDATHTAIEEEITKEIKLRTQQYEYYREKLLTFPEN